MTRLDKLQHMNVDEMAEWICLNCNYWYIVKTLGITIADMERLKRNTNNLIKRIKQHLLERVEDKPYDYCRQCGKPLHSHDDCVSTSAGIMCSECAERSE